MTAPQRKNISSCSPELSRPTKPRNSEISNPMRRSFSGNPFAKPFIIANQRPGFNPNTPANSPSGYPRRNSIGRENIVVSLREYEENENSKDQISKSHRVRSPTSSKGTKNFTSPTISAISKIDASPRKKILMEMNEPVRTSVSFSDGKYLLKEDLDLKPEKGLNQKKGVSFDPTITYLEDKEALNGNEDLDSVVNSNILDGCTSFSDSVAVENDFVNLDPSFNISPRTSCSLPSPALAPLDPLVPPYDPKTNYLSPRPQFLHYKPNPRIELHLNGERDGKQLEDSFASESSSDAEVTEEETVSNESSSDSQKKSDDAASEDVVTEKGEELPVSEPDSMNTSAGVVEARRVLRLHFLTRTKFTALLFVLAIVGLWASVSNSPVMDPSVLNNLNFPNLYVPPEISHFIRDHLEGLTQKFRQWLFDYLSYIHNLIISFIEQHKPSPLQFANLTILLEDSTVDNYLPVDRSNFGAEVKYKRKREEGSKLLDEEEADEKVEKVAEIQSSPEEDDEPVEGDENIEEDFERDSNDTHANTEEIAENEDQEIEDQELIVAPDNFEVSLVHIVPESEEESMMNQPEVIQERVDTTEDIAVLRSNTDVIEQPVPDLEAAEIDPEVSDLKQSLAEIVVDSAEIDSTKTEFKPESLELDGAKMEPQSAGLVDMTVDGIKNLLLKQEMMGISLIVLSLLAVVPFVCMKNRTSAAPNAAIKVDHVPISLKVYQTPLSVTPGGAFQERTSSRHWQMEIETLGESCPSEMSSFQYSSSYSKQEQKDCEAQSHERRPKSNFRRESLASSDCSMGSVSYGSFTTYEKLHVKHGNGEVECLTPVRRSSRIRNHVVTSP